MYLERIVYKMTQEEMLTHVDHTLLVQTATWNDIKQILDDAMKYKVASACIPASFVKEAAEYVNGKLAICTVIGFPNGYATTASKVFMAKDAVNNGAKLELEIKAIKEAVGNLVLKVIIETCLLTDEEKVKMCEIVTKAGADYIKTSTGFSTAGATFDDVKLFNEHVGKNVKIKAAGGIASLDDAYKFLELGADRLGTSRIVKLVKGQEATGY